MCTLHFLLSCIIISVVSAQGEESCVGRCGQGYFRANPCQCDYTCMSYMECCPDFKTVCTTEGSCKGRCHEGFIRGQTCDCDPSCVSFGKCCPDYKEQCVPPTEKPRPSPTPRQAEKPRPSPPPRQAEKPRPSPPPRQADPELKDNAPKPSRKPEEKAPEDLPEDDIQQDQPRPKKTQLLPVDKKDPPLERSLPSTKRPKKRVPRRPGKKRYRKLIYPEDDDDDDDDDEEDPYEGNAPYPRRKKKYLKKNRKYPESKTPKKKKKLIVLDYDDETKDPREKSSLRPRQKDKKPKKTSKLPKKKSKTVVQSEEEIEESEENVSSSSFSSSSSSSSMKGIKKTKKLSRKNKTKKKPGDEDDKPDPDTADPNKRPNKDDKPKQPKDPRIGEDDPSDPREPNKRPNNPNSKDDKPKDPSIKEDYDDPNTPSDPKEPNKRPNNPSSKDDKPKSPKDPTFKDDDPNNPSDPKEPNKRPNNPSSKDDKLKSPKDPTFKDDDPNNPSDPKEPNKRTNNPNSRDDNNDKPKRPKDPKIKEDYDVTSNTTEPNERPKNPNSKDDKDKPKRSKDPWIKEDTDPDDQKDPNKRPKKPNNKDGKPKRPKDSRIKEDYDYTSETEETNKRANNKDRSLKRSKIRKIKEDYDDDLEISPKDPNKRPKKRNDKPNHSKDPKIKEEHDDPSDPPKDPNKRPKDRDDKPNLSKDPKIKEDDEDPSDPPKDPNKRPKNGDKKPNHPKDPKIKEGQEDPSDPPKDPNKGPNNKDDKSNHPKDPKIKEDYDDTSDPPKDPNKRPKNGDEKPNHPKDPKIKEGQEDPSDPPKDPKNVPENKDDKPKKPKDPSTGEDDPKDPKDPKNVPDNKDDKPKKPKDSKTGEDDPKDPKDPKNVPDNKDDKPKKPKDSKTGEDDPKDPKDPKNVPDNKDDKPKKPKDPKTGEDDPKDPKDPKNVPDNKDDKPKKPKDPKTGEDDPGEPKDPKNVPDNKDNGPKKPKDPKTGEDDTKDPKNVPDNKDNKPKPEDPKTGEGDPRNPKAPANIPDSRDDKPKTPKDPETKDDPNNPETPPKDNDDDVDDDENVSSNPKNTKKRSPSNAKKNSRKPLNPKGNPDDQPRKPLKKPTLNKPKKKKRIFYVDYDDDDEAGKPKKEKKPKKKPSAKDLVKKKKVKNSEEERQETVESEYSSSSQSSSSHSRSKSTRRLTGKNKKKLTGKNKKPYPDEDPLMPPKKKKEKYPFTTPEPDEGSGEYGSGTDVVQTSTLLSTSSSNIVTEITTRKTTAVTNKPKESVKPTITPQTEKSSKKTTPNVSTLMSTEKQTSPATTVHYPPSVTQEDKNKGLYTTSTPPQESKNDIKTTAINNLETSFSLKSSTLSANIDEQSSTRTYNPTTKDLYTDSTVKTTSVLEPTTTNVGMTTSYTGANTGEKTHGDIGGTVSLGTSRKVTIVTTGITHPNKEPSQKITPYHSITKDYTEEPQPLSKGDKNNDRFTTRRSPLFNVTSPPSSSTNTPRSNSENISKGTTRISHEKFNLTTVPTTTSQLIISSDSEVLHTDKISINPKQQSLEGKTTTAITMGYTSKGPTSQSKVTENVLSTLATDKASEQTAEPTYKIPQITTNLNAMTSSAQTTTVEQTNSPPATTGKENISVSEANELNTNKPTFYVSTINTSPNQIYEISTPVEKTSHITPEHTDMVSTSYTTKTSKPITDITNIPTAFHTKNALIKATEKDSDTLIVTEEPIIDNVSASGIPSVELTITTGKVNPTNAKTTNLENEIPNVTDIVEITKENLAAPNVTPTNRQQDTSTLPQNSPTNAISTYIKPSTMFNDVTLSPETHQASATSTYHFSKSTSQDNTATPTGRGSTKKTQSLSVSEGNLSNTTPNTDSYSSLYPTEHILVSSIVPAQTAAVSPSVTPVEPASVNATPREPDTGDKQPEVAEESTKHPDITLQQSTLTREISQFPAISLSEKTQKASTGTQDISQRQPTTSSDLTFLATVVSEGAAVEQIGTTLKGKEPIATTDESSAGDQSPTVTRNEEGNIPVTTERPLTLESDNERENIMSSTHKMSLGLPNVTDIVEVTKENLVSISLTPTNNKPSTSPLPQNSPTSAIGTDKTHSTKVTLSEIHRASTTPTDYFSKSTSHDDTVIPTVTENVVSISLTSTSSESKTSLLPQNNPTSDVGTDIKYSTKLNDVTLSPETHQASTTLTDHLSKSTSQDDTLKLTKGDSTKETQTLSVSDGNHFTTPNGSIESTNNDLNESTLASKDTSTLSTRLSTEVDLERSTSESPDSYTSPYSIEYTPASRNVPAQTSVLSSSVAPAESELVNVTLAETFSTQAETADTSTKQSDVTPLHQSTVNSEISLSAISLSEVPSDISTGKQDISQRPTDNTVVSENTNTTTTIIAEEQHGLTTEQAYKSFTTVLDKSSAADQSPAVTRNAEENIPVTTNERTPTMEADNEGKNTMPTTHQTRLGLTTDLANLVTDATNVINIEKENVVSSSLTPTISEPKTTLLPKNSPSSATEKNIEHSTKLNDFTLSPEMHKTSTTPTDYFSKSTSATVMLTGANTAHYTDSYKAPYSTEHTLLSSIIPAQTSDVAPSLTPEESAVNVTPAETDTADTQTERADVSTKHPDITPLHQSTVTREISLAISLSEITRETSNGAQDMLQRQPITGNDITIQPTVVLAETNAEQINASTTMIAEKEHIVTTEQDKGSTADQSPSVTRDAEEIIPVTTNEKPPTPKADNEGKNITSVPKYSSTMATTPGSSSFRLLDRQSSTGKTSISSDDILSVVHTTRPNGLTTEKTIEDPQVSQEFTEGPSVFTKDPVSHMLFSIEKSTMSMDVNENISGPVAFTTLRSSEYPPDPHSTVSNFVDATGSNPQSYDENNTNQNHAHVHVSSPSTPPLTKSSVTKSTHKSNLTSAISNLHAPSFNFTASTMKTTNSAGLKETTMSKFSTPPSTKPNKGTTAKQATSEVYRTTTLANVSHGQGSGTSATTLKSRDLPSTDVPVKIITSTESYLKTTTTKNSNDITVYKESTTASSDGTFSKAATESEKSTTELLHESKTPFESTKENTNNKTPSISKFATSTESNLVTSRPVTDNVKNLAATTPQIRYPSHICDLLKEEATQLKISQLDLQYIIQICAELERRYQTTSTPLPETTQPNADDRKLPPRSPVVYGTPALWNKEPRIIQIVEEINRRINNYPIANLTRVPIQQPHNVTAWLLLLSKIRQTHDPQMNLCIGPPADGMTTLQNGSVVVFRGNYFWTLNQGGIAGNPQRISDVWGIPSPIDTVFTRCNCGGKTFFFKGPLYWRFTNDIMDKGYPKQIIKGFGGLQGRVTAVLSVSGFRTRPESVYFFKTGGNVQKYTFRQEQTKRCTKKKTPSINYPIYSQKVQTVRFRIPREIVTHRIKIHRTFTKIQQPLGFLHQETSVRLTWRGIPNNIISALSLPNPLKQDGFDYFVFTKDKYYNINMSSKVAVKPPLQAEQKITKDWYKCKE